MSSISQIEDFLPLSHLIASAYVFQPISTPGDYLLQLDAMDLYADAFYGGTLDWQSATLVHVTDGHQTAGIDFVLFQYNSGISGTVTDEDGVPLNRCAVFAYSDPYSPAPYGTTDSAEKYRVFVPRGSYRLCVHDWESRGYASQWYGNADRYQTAMQIQVAAAETVKGKDFTIAMGGTIVGQVTAPSGGTIEPYALFVEVVDADGTPITETEDDSVNGFVHMGIPSGSYKILAAYDGSDNLLDTWYGDVTDEASAEFVQVHAPDTTSGISMTLPPRGGIAGTVTGPGGASLDAAASIAVYDVDRQLVLSSSVSQTGRYKFGVLSEYWNRMKEQDSLAVTYYPHGASFFDTTAAIYGFKTQIKGTGQMS